MGALKRHINSEIAVIHTFSDAYNRKWVGFSFLILETPSPRVK